MASLIAATFAIRERTASHVSAQDHDFRAHRERLSADWLEGGIEEAKRKLEHTPHISRDQVAGYDVRLINSVANLGVLPATGKNLVIVGHTDGGIYFRIFDGDGGVVVDWAEGGRERIGFLEKQLASLDPPHELTANEKGWVITAVTSLVDGYRAAVQASIISGQARHAEAVVRAEFHERLGERP
jgi:hypothetical protein